MIDHLIIDRSRPVVFLDMCGVLGDTWLVMEDWSWAREGRHRCRVNDVPGDVTIAAAHDLLIDIFRLFDVQVIVVSSWVSSYLGRDHPDVRSFAQFLGYDDVLGSLRTSGGPERGEAVKELVLKQELSFWAVIDDSKDQMYLDKQFFNADHFVHPDARFGFWQKEAEHLTLILGEPSEEQAWGRKLHGMSLINDKEGSSDV